MIHIPTIRLELYEQDRGQFVQQLGQALEPGTAEVAQISGLQQEWADELCARSERIFRRYLKRVDPTLSEYDYEKVQEVNRQHHRQTLRLFYASRMAADPQFKVLAGKVVDNFEEIHRKAWAGVRAYFGENALPDIPRYQEFLLVQYSPDEETTLVGEELILMKDHPDGRALTITSKATKPGLEGLIHGERVSLEPQAGHVLVFRNTFRHRVRVSLPFTEPRRALVYGGV